MMINKSKITNGIGRFILPVIFLAMSGWVGSASAALIEFVPPNDTAGAVFSRDVNDAWNSNRGIGFQATAAGKTINSIGLWQDLTNITLNYGIYEIDSASGSVNRTATLRTGSSTVTTTGLEWIDYSFAALALDNAKTYLLEFSFAGNSNQNFFYNNNNVAWSQDGYVALEGTRDNNFNNSLVGAFRVNEAESAVVPEPSIIALFGLGLLGLGFSRRRKAQS